ncbi:IS30 family transposase [Peptoanaerobacter stomatis]
MKRLYYNINFKKNQQKQNKYKHLSYEQRLQIEFYLKNKKKLKFTMKDIAKTVEISERTLYREIKRGMVYGLLNSNLTKKDEYSAQKSQEKYSKNITQKQRQLKIGKNLALANYLECLMLEKKYSPYAAIIQARKDGYEVNICEKTLYNYINQELFYKLEAKNLPYKRRKKSKVKKQKTIRKIGGKSIEKRPVQANERMELGHKEIDSVVGKRQGNSCCLLVITDRLSRLQTIKKIKSKTSKCVVQEIQKLKKQYPKTFNERFKTITSDNGSEFMDAKSIEDMEVEYYYAHSYCSYERGSNENNNKFIRRFIKKGEDISKVSHKKVKEIQDWMNNYPRRMFGTKSANEVHLEHRILEQ